MWNNRNAAIRADDANASLPDMGPTVPERPGSFTGRSLRWFFFAAILLYLLIFAFHAQILTSIGGFLIVEHKPSRSDLIVCLSGMNIERGLGAAEAFHKGLAPRIFIAPEGPPDGLDLLLRKGIQYPQTIDLMLMLLQGLGVPRSAILIGAVPSFSTIEEARMVEALVRRENYHSLILITSPTHSRRAYLTFRKVLERQDIRIQVVPTPYSKFKPESWWEHRKYVRELILEYEKLVYYYLKELW